MHKITKYITLLLVICTSLQTPFAYADAELENATLARIHQVLESLAPLINEAELQQDRNARVQFQYPALRHDINQIKQGIDQKLNPPSIQPRSIAPLHGDYLSLKSKQQ